MPAQVTDVLELRWRVTELEGELEEKKLQLQTLTGLAEKIATLQSKVKGMRSATTCLQSEGDAVFMMMDEIRALVGRGTVPD